MVPDLPLEEMERRKRLYEAAHALLEALGMILETAHLSAHDEEELYRDSNLGKIILAEIEAQARAAIALAVGEPTR